MSAHRSTPAPAPGPAAASGPGPVPVASVPSFVQAADPVRELMHRHRELCERAVDPLEIAAALEAQGVTDRVAARYRHRDVFSLAEELFARVPRSEGRCPGPAAGARAPSSALVPASSSSSVSSCASVSGSGPVAALDGAGPGSPRMLRSLLAVVVGVVCAAAVAVLASGAPGTSAASTSSAGPARTGLDVAVGLACALVPAVWCVRWFGVRAGRRLELSRSLDEFASGVRPLLTAAVSLFTGALAGLQLLAREVTALAAPRSEAPPAQLLPVMTALGLLLFAALLLAVHGFRGTAAAGLVAACALQAAAASVTGSASASAEASGSASASASAVAAACGCAALFLLARAYALLGRASAHRPRGDGRRANGERRANSRRRASRGAPPL